MLVKISLQSVTNHRKTSKFYSVLCVYDISKHQLKLLHVKHKFLFNTLYLKNYAI